MSFYIKQYRDYSNHWSKMEYSLGEIETTINYFITNKYKDATVDVTNTMLKKGEKYFLSVVIDRIGAGENGTGNQETGNTEKEMTIKLLAVDNDGNSTILNPKNQYIDTIILPKVEKVDGKIISTSSFNFIITPNDNYERIAFILSRDLTKKNDADLRVKIDVKIFTKLQNLIGNVIKDFDSNINITQIGIHAKPGTLMCINGEPIKIGKRGVFELNSVFRLQQMSPPNNSQDSTTDISQPETVGISFLNIINLNENKEPKEYYTIDYRYIKVKEAT